MPPATLDATYRMIRIRTLDRAGLEKLSARMRLSLSGDDMEAIQEHFRGLGRDATDVELEVLAQTWSEHCKHRVFNALIEHTADGRVEMIDGIFRTFVRSVTEEIMAAKPGFVLSAFTDNAGFIRLDDELAACLKAETHNHPSAIEPYAGANTGLGGVIRDILGAGRGAEPIASLDVFCFGHPDTPASAVPAGSLHPLGIFRGVVRGVRDYGNRMGIPTVAGAIHFGAKYTTNPIVFCGTAGIIPIDDIGKEVVPGQRIVVVGGRTGHDGLHGATFSSASLDADSQETDQGAVQIGNPIEEKKVADLILAARREGLIAHITDCGAGGLSSAIGEMVEDRGGIVHLEKVPLKTPGLSSWEIFLSESQERMVLGVAPEDLPRMRELAAIYETDCTDIGEVTEGRLLEVHHHDSCVCRLDTGFLHAPPRKRFRSEYSRPQTPETATPASTPAAPDPATLLRRILGDSNTCSREPIIRQYDHEVKGNTVGKPLGGRTGDAPQDASVLRIDGSAARVAMTVSLLPQYGEQDPYRMGLASVDEAMRQLTAVGADPDRVALLDNFCLGDPGDPVELGRLVECARGMAEAARAFEAPFVSGKDSFYNCTETPDGTINIPATLLISALGVIPPGSPRVGASIRSAGNLVAILGETRPEQGGSAAARITGITGGDVPGLQPTAQQAHYRRFHEAIGNGWIRSAHDLSEGGLGVAIAEAAFSLAAGVEVDLDALPVDGHEDAASALFSESNGRLLFEIAEEDREAVASHFDGCPFAIIGRTVADHRRLRIRHAGNTVVDEDLPELKELWKNGLEPWC